MPSTRSLALGAGAVALAGLPGLAVAQSTSPGGTGLGLIGRFVAGLVVYLLLGGGLVALAPRYADETVAEIRDDPVSAFGWGLVAGILVPIGLAILAVTIIGLIVAIPGFILLFLLGIVGNAVTIVWIGTLLGDRRAGGEAAVLGAVVLAAVSAIPVLGDLLWSLLGLVGLGVVSRRLYRDRQGGDGGGGTRRERPTPTTSPDRRRDDL